ALARRLVAGSLDRAVDVAATLELRGYALPGRGATGPAPRSRHDRRFALAGAAILAGGVVAKLAGIGGFDPYPEVTMDRDAATLLLAAALPLVAVAPFARPRSRPVRARRREAHAHG
ncbi:MAG: hypothetical protein ACRDMA_00975, partial [Solirubrobacterales bacterium]